MAPHTEPVAEESPALESLPDAGDGMSFESSLEAAFADLDAASDEQAQVEESSSETAENAEAPAEEDVKETEPTNTTDVAAENADVSDEPLEALSDDIGDDWTPKAASRFKQLKSELKSSKSELDMLRQQQQEYESNIK